MTMRLIGNEFVKLASAQRSNLFGKVFSWFEIVQSAVNVFSEFSPMCSGGNQDRIFSSKLLSNFVCHGGMGVDEVVVILPIVRKQVSLSTASALKSD